MIRISNMNKASIWKFSLLLVILILFGSIGISSVEGIIPESNTFFGNIIVNDEPGPDGCIIEAYIDGELHSGTINGKDYDVSNGEYFVNITGDESDHGKLITFKVNGIIAQNEPATWIASELPVTQRLDLYVALPKNGDIDGDDDVDINDAIYLVRYYYENKYPGSFPEYSFIYANGDIDCNGDIIITDAIYISRYYYENKYPGSFPGYENLYPSL